MFNEWSHLRNCKSVNVQAYQLYSLPVLLVKAIICMLILSHMICLIVMQTEKCLCKKYFAFSYILLTIGCTIKKAHRYLLCDAWMSIFDSRFNTLSQKPLEYSLEIMRPELEYGMRFTGLFYALLVIISQAL